MEELIKLDNSFNEDMFISKVNNIFVMLHMAIITNNLDRVRHYINNDVENKYENILNDYSQKNVKIIYDELNVKSTEITDVKIKDNKAIIKVKLVSRYIEYYIDTITNKHIAGNTNSRIEKIHYLTLEKVINNKPASIAPKCPRCGASTDINKTGKCVYCKTTFDLEGYDWVLTSIETEI